MNTIITQGLGFLGLILLVISFQKNDRKFTLVFHFLTGLCLITHFYMLGAMTAACTSVIVTLRSAIKFYSDKVPFFNTKTMMYLIITSLWIVPIFTWDGVISLLSAILMTFESFGLWSTSNSRMRYLFLAGRPFAMTYNIVVGSVAGIFIEIFMIATLSVSIYRFDAKHEATEKLAIKQ